MFYKKAIAIALCFVIGALLSSCQKDGPENIIPEATVSSVAEEVFKDVTNTSSHISDSNIEYSTVSTQENTEVSETATESISSVNPSDWSISEIIDAYKKAASKSHNSVKSEQVITMKDFSINNGQYENVIDFVMPIMSKILANNSTEKDGITGGYQNLSEADVISAKAYASGNNTVIELVMKNQSDGPRSDALSGPVGHAITAVGDIGVVTDQINDLGIAIEISDKDTKINYTNATVKILIDKDGNIVKGTWQYTVDIRLNNYKVGKSTVETTSVVMDNVITVNGGF